MKKALVFYGGWEGHDPYKVSHRFGGILSSNGFEIEYCEGVECLSDRDRLMGFDLIVPVITGSEMPREYSQNVTYAVAHGVGLGGCHGGMCDSFRQDTDWQFMTGGQWVAHPGNDGVKYTVNIRRSSSPIVEGIEDFEYCSEQYYLHYDPSVEILATTRFPLVNYRHASNKPVDMPVIWTKYWGIGRVFYCSLGHHDDEFDRFPTAELIMKRGLLWAAEGKEYAKEHGLSGDKYDDLSVKLY